MDNTRRSMSDIHMEIEDLLDNTKFMIDEIAKILDIPVYFVEKVVEQRWQDILAETEVNDD